jgi:hypothetical protein
MSNISRQYGVHEIPGTEEEAPNKARQVSAGFEASMRDYIGAIWVKLGELEHSIDDFKEWREELNYRRLSRVSPEPLSSVHSPGEATGEGYGDEPGSTMVGVRAVPPKRTDKPWAAEGVSKATWYRRHKGGV